MGNRLENDTRLVSRNNFFTRLDKKIKKLVPSAQALWVLRLGIPIP